MGIIKEILFYTSVIYVTNYMLIRTNFINVNLFATKEIYLQSLLSSLITTVIFTIVLILFVTANNISNKIKEIMENIYN